MNGAFIDEVFYKNAQNMSEIPDAAVNLVIASPPYFNKSDRLLDRTPERLEH